MASAGFGRQRYPDTGLWLNADCVICSFMLIAPESFKPIMTESNSFRGALVTDGAYGFLHFATAAALRCLIWQLPCRKTGALLFLGPDRMAVAAERCTEYIALSIGCRALLAFWTTFGVIARFTARPGCTARRTLRGMNNLEKKPTNTPFGLQNWLRS
jgi:hypothetical protein